MEDRGQQPLTLGQYPAPAKINLFLHVLGRRPDGYHRLQTAFRFLDFGDTLTVDVLSDGTIERSVEIDGVARADDLCLRAARLLQAHTGCRLGARIGLQKRIPIGGGLGGGSSDAATCLLALNRLWGLGLACEELQSLGRSLGADVPVFVFGRSAFADGVGDELTGLELPQAWYAILAPPVAISTREVFGYPDIPRDTAPMAPAEYRCGAGTNDLQAAVARRFPQVDAALRSLARFGAARMSGSGACVFAAFDRHEDALAAFAARPDGVAGFVARGLDRHPLYDPAPGI